MCCGLLVSSYGLLFLHRTSIHPTSYLPFQTGFLFSINACKPSAGSSVFRASPSICFMSFCTSAAGNDFISLKASKPRRIADGEYCRMSATSVSTAASNSAGSTTSLIKPRLFASCALTLRARIQKSSTVRVGIICNMLCITWKGYKPRLTSGNAKVALLLAITCVQPHTIKKPPANTGACTFAIVGLPTWRRAFEASDSRTGMLAG